MYRLNLTPIDHGQIADLPYRDFLIREPPFSDLLGLLAESQDVFPHLKFVLRWRVPEAILQQLAPLLAYFARLLLDSIVQDGPEPLGTIGVACIRQVTGFFGDVDPV